MADETHPLTPPNPSRDDRLEAVLADYLQQIEQGAHVDQKALLAQHPELADDLREFIANQQRLQRIVGKGPGVAAPHGGSVPGKLKYFGDYEILEEIAHGGMGVVYKARQTTLNRIVAVKMILAGQLANESDVKRFQAEAEAAANLHHPGVVGIYEVGVQDGQHYYSMEYIDGQNLAQAVREKPLPVAKAAEYVREIAEVLTYAHQRGVLHRDLKPSNILIDAADRVRITDFGLAKRVEGGSDLTITGQVLGTPSYMSPEQAAAQHTLIGPATDVYSLGAVLYELLTGRPPFRSENIGETLRQVQHDEPVRPRLLNPKLPRDLETICLKCLEKEPRSRYGTTQVLADDLGRYLRHEPILARPISRPERAWRWCRRNPLAAGLTCGIMLSLIAGTALSTYFAIAEKKQAGLANMRENDAVIAKNSANTQRQIAVKQAGELKKSNEQLVHQSQVMTEQAQKLRERQAELYRSLLKLAHSQAQGNHIALADENLNSFPEEFRGWAWRYAKRLCHPEFLALPGKKCIAFDPTGQSLATATGNSIKLYRVPQGNVVAELNGHTAPVIALAFAGPDQLVSIAEDSTARLWNIPGRREVRQLACPEGPRDVAATSDGNHAAVAGNRGIARLWNLTDGAIRAIDHGNDDVVQVALSHDGKLLASGTAGNLGLRPTVQIWETATGNLDARYSNVDFLRLIDFTIALEGAVTIRVEDLEFSPDGKLLAVAQADSVKLVDLEHGRIHKSLSDHFGGVYGVSFSGDGQLLSSASSDGMVRVWSTFDGRCLRTLPWHEKGVRRVAFCPTQPWLASLDEKHVMLWNVSESWDAQIAPTHTDAAYCIAFDGKGSRLATGGGRHDGAGKDNVCSEVRVVDVLSGNNVFAADIPVANGRSPGVLAVALSPDGSQVAAAGREGQLRVWDIPSRRIVMQVDRRGHAYSLAFTPDATELLVAGLGGTEIFDITSGQKTSLFNNGEYATFSPDGGTIYACGRGHLIAWDVAQKRERYNIKTSANAWRLAVSPDNLLIALALDTRFLPKERKGEFAQLRDTRTGALVRILSSQMKRDYADEDFVTSVYGVSFSADSRQLATGSGDKTVRIWDVATGGELLVFPHSNQVFCVAFSPNGQHLASASGHWSGPRPGEVRIWNAIPDRMPPK